MIHGGWLHPRVGAGASPDEAPSEFRRTLPSKLGAFKGDGTDSARGRVVHNFHVVKGRAVERVCPLGRQHFDRKEQGKCWSTSLSAQGHGPSSCGIASLCFRQAMRAMAIACSAYQMERAMSSSRFCSSSREAWADAAPSSVTEMRMSSISIRWLSSLVLSSTFGLRNSLS